MAVFTVVCFILAVSVGAHDARRRCLDANPDAPQLCIGSSPSLGEAFAEGAAEGAGRALGEAIGRALFRGH